VVVRAPRAGSLRSPTCLPLAPRRRPRRGFRRRGAVLSRAS
jgi:hypothetical protein